MTNLNNKQLIGELDFCIDLWEKQGYCEFGEYTKCENCGAPYILYKMITGKALHGDIKRLNLGDWKEKLKTIKKS